MSLLLTTTITLVIFLLSILFAVVYFRWLQYKLLGIRLSYSVTVYQLLIWLVVYGAFLFVGLSIFLYMNQIVGYWLLNLSWLFSYGVLHYIVTYKNSTSLFRTIKLFIIYSIGVFFCFIIGIALLRAFLFTPFLVAGDGMVPTFTHDDYLILQRSFLDIDRGDVVAFQENEKYFLQRVIGLPGEVIEVVDGTVLVSGEPLHESYVVNSDQWNYGPVTLGNKEYFLLDDNRSKPVTPRVAGTVAREQFVGQYVFRINLGRDDW